MVEITSSYRDYQPPCDVEGAVRRMIDVTPAEYLSGLRTIVLRNSASLNHERRRSKTLSRKRKVAVAKCGGLYHRRWNSEPAWIEIFVDNVLDGLPWVFLRVPLLRDAALADTLFHEIGHHIHFTKVPEHKEREDVAEKWKKRLSGKYIRTRYWYLLPLFVPLAKAVKMAAYVRQ